MEKKHLIYSLVGLALLLGGCANPGADNRAPTAAQVLVAAPVVLAVGSANVIAPDAGLSLAPGERVARLGSGRNLATVQYSIAVVPRGMQLEIGDEVELAAAPGTVPTIVRIISRR